MASAYDARGPPGGPPPHYSNGRGGPPPPHAGYGGSGRSSSFERPRGGGGGSGGGGPVNFSSSYEVPPSPIATGGTPPPMSISADESDEGGRSGQRDAYGRAAAAEAEAYHRAQARGREYARHDGGRGDPRDYGGHPPPHRDGRGRGGYDQYDRDRRARSHSRSHAPQPHPEDRAPPGGSIFRGPYEDHPGGYSAAAAAAAHEEAERRRQYEHERAAYEQGYDPRDPRVDPRGDPRARPHHPPPPPDRYRQHHHSAPPPPGHQHHHHQGWGHPGGRTETPPPRTSSLPRMADGHHPLPAAVSPPDRAGARSGDSVASSDHGGSIHGHPPSAMTTPVNTKDREYMGGSGRPPTGKPPSSVMAAAAASAAGINPAAGVIVSPPPLPHEARLAGHRRMPCRARSVPVGHTPQTAYLSIPPDAPHGMVLVCSHPECAASGKRFRFCAVCDIPVAKRNFLKRHSHGLVSPGSPAAQVGQPGAITGKEAVEMARSLGTVSPSTGNTSGAGTPASPGSQTASGGEGTGEDNSDEEEDAEEQAAADAEDAATEKDAQDAKKKAQETKDSKDKSDSKDVTLCRPCPARAPSLGEAGASMPMSPGCLSTGSIRPRSDSDDSNRSAFGSPVKRQRDGGSTPPKDRLRPPESIDLTLPRMPGDDGPHGADDRDAKVKVTPVSDEGKPRGRSVSGMPKVPPSRDMSPAAFSSASGRRPERGESPRPMSPPALRTCRTFPLPPPHRDPRFAAANAEASEGEGGEAHHQDSQEAYYYRRSPAPWGGPGAHHHSASASAAPASPHRDYYRGGYGDGSDECPPTPSRIMVAGVSAHSRPGAALSFDHERHRRSLADSALSESCRSGGNDNQCLSDNEDVGLNAHSFHGGNDRRSSSASSLTYRRSNTGGDAPVHRFRARLRAREHSSARSTGRLAFGRSSSRLSSSGRSASSASGMGLTSPRASPTSGTEGAHHPSKSNNDFEPPTPHASVVRLSRRERQWLELLRNKPSMGDVDNLEEWMDRVLDISDETAAPPDEGEGEDSRGNSMEEDAEEDGRAIDHDADANADATDEQPRALNEVVRPTRPRPIWPESDSDPPSDDGADPAQDNRMRTDRDDGDDADNAGVNRHRLRPPHLPLSRTETPLHENSSKGGDCLMDARAEAKRNLQVRAAAVASTRGGSSGILDHERERAESRTDIDAEDHSLSEEGGVHGAHSDKNGRRGSVTSARTMSRDIPTPPPMCFADGARSGLAGLFGCGAFLCAETGQVSGMEPSSHQEGAGSFLLEGGRGGPCAPCGGNAVDDGSAGRSFRAGGGAGTPVQLDMPAPIQLNKRVDSNVSAASSVSMTGSSMVDMLEGTGLMPGTPGGQYSFHHHSHSHNPTHTPRNSDGEFRYLDGINLDSPFPPAPSPRGRMSTGSVSNMDEDRDMKAAAAEAEEEVEKAKGEGGDGEDKNEAGEKTEDDDEGGETKRTGLLASPPRGKHHIQKKTLPSLPSLKSDPAKGGAGAMEEFRVGDVSISMKKSVDEDDAKGGRGCDDHEEVETELKVEEEDKEEGGGKEAKVKQEDEAVKST